MRQVQDKEIISTGQSRTKAIIYRGIGIPPIYCCKLKYSENFSITSSPFNDTIIRGNGAYDPNFSVGGFQPMYWDELATLYRRYCVLSSSITATFINRSATGGSSFTKVGIYPLGEATLPIDLNEATERDNCKYAQLGPNSGDQGIITINSYAKSAQVLGKAKDENTDDVLSAEVTTNPARQFYWHIFSGTLDALTNTSLYCDVTVVYYIKFYDRDDVGRS